jgi:hypothetical protein
MDDKTLNEIKKFAYTEVFFIIMTCITAALQLWPAFAILALLCVLLPLWIIAVAIIVGTLIQMPPTKKQSE